MSVTKRVVPMDLTNIVTTDLAGITRGRAVPTKALDEYCRKGCNWAPAMGAITPQNGIAETNPWGPNGDLRLLPDRNSRVQIENGPDDNAPSFDMIHSDLVETDGTAWAGCARTLLAQEIKRYRDSLGLKVFAAFEHEFVLSEQKCFGNSTAFSLKAIRDAGAFPGWLMAAFEAANMEPEVFMSEFGHHQYEITCRPTYGVAVADRAVNVREITREIARQMNLYATFSPKASMSTIGTGVHLHLSLQDLNGQPALYDAGRPYDLSLIGEHWAAGVVRHMPALCAFTAPTPVSYLRLRPQHWSSDYGCVGYRNREAALRISPTVSLDNESVAKQYNLEFRPMDATASPHLAMASLLIAGRLGIEQKLKLTAFADADPHNMTPAEREKQGITILPSNLSLALENLQNDKEFLQELPKPLVDTYFAIKRQELATTSELDDQAICKQYSQLY